MNKITEYGSRDDLSRAVAGLVSEALQDAIDARNRASFVASGGTTPKQALDLLAIDDQVAWDKVTVTLSDERIAPPAAKVSNAEMVRTHLLHGAAAQAQFLPLETTASLDDLPLPFDVVLLGMGADGHFASIFPEGEGMEAATKDDAPVLVETAPSPPPPKAPFPRLSLSLPTILGARHLILMISDEIKRQVFEQAISEGADSNLPIRHLLGANAADFTIHWAP